MNGSIQHSIKTKSINLLKLKIMKKILFVLTISLACNLFTQAQVLQDSARRVADRELGMAYLTKSKNQRTAGFVVLGLGISAMVGGLAIAYNDWNSSGSEVLLLVGLGATITSFPLFNSASKNKGRAEILLRYENIPLASIVPMNRNMPAVGVAFNIR